MRLVGEEQTNRNWVQEALLEREAVLKVVEELGEGWVWEAKLRDLDWWQIEGLDWDCPWVRAV
jgi:hypothetical protein